MSESYYELLGVSPDATEEDIKQAYRKQVKQYHPDINDAPDARETFMQIREAKNVLTDPEQREQYDRRRQHDQQTNTQSATAGRTNTETGTQTHIHNPWSETQHQHGRPNDRWSRTRSQKRTRNRHARTRESHTPEQQPAGTAHTDGTSGRIRRGIVRLYQYINWVSHPLSPPYPKLLTPTLLRSVVTAPTTIRLCVAGALAAVFTVIAQSMGVVVQSPTGPLGIVLVSVLLSYAGYGLLTPLPFEDERSRERTPAGNARLWPIIGVNLFGVCLLVIAASRGDVIDGMAFVVNGVAAYIIMGGLFALLFRQGLAWLAAYLYEPATPHAARVGGSLGPVVTPIVLFTQWGGMLSLPTLLRTTQSVPTPWVGRFMLGPVYLGLLVNVLIGVVLLIGLIWSLVAMCRRLTAAPWSDRYEHGYRVRPSAWNLALVIPIIVLAWMVAMDIQRIAIPVPVGGELVLGQHILGAVVVVMPTGLTGAYILRRRVEPLLG